MADPTLEQAVQGIPSLRGVFVAAMPDGLLFDAWTRPAETWVREDASAYFGDLVRANRKALKSLGSWSADLEVTVAASDLLLVLRELGAHFFVAFAFERKAPVEMVRQHIEATLPLLEALLLSAKPKQPPRAVQIKDYLLRYAPDPHAALQRVSLRTHLSLEDLAAPERLDEVQCEKLERCVMEILGVERLNL